MINLKIDQKIQKSMYNECNEININMSNGVKYYLLISFCFIDRANLNICIVMDKRMMMKFQENEKKGWLEKY